MYAAAMPLTFGSLFAGVGGIDLGLEAAGWQCHWQVEWDPNCQQTLGYHWPSVPKWLDVRDARGYELPPVDVITFGSPCQDLSVAGRRAGLEGSRSGLFFEATRIIKEMQDATFGTFPKWAIWENVGGALSSRDGDDFASVLTEMGNLGAHIIEWSVLDAQFFGVPQRRRRVFLVCCFDSATAERGGFKVLTVGKGRSRNSAKGSEQGQESSAVAEAGIGVCGPSVNDVQLPFTPSQHANYKEGFGTLRANGGDIGGGSETLVVEQANPCIFGTLRSGGDGGVPSSRGEHIVVQPIAIDGRRNDDVRIDDSGIMRTLEARMGTGGNNVPYVAVNDVVIFSHTQGLDPQASHTSSPTLRVGGNGMAVAHESPLGLIVRKLTPIECERLMGWPDNHTLHRADGKLNSDTTRYKMCGNGVASPVAQWVAECINNFHVDTPL